MLRPQEPNTVNGRRPRQDRDPLIGTRLDDRYLIEERLATGGFGAVYRARTADGQRVALKILHPWLTTDDNMVARFRREGVTLTQLHDPHTVTTLAVGETRDGTLYIAMELLTGESLHDRLQRVGALPWQTAVAIARAVCSSLAEAHALGVVHRDLKPANIQIETGDDGGELVKVIDFGIVKITRGSAIDDGRELTYAGHMIGTYDYMSPEQIIGDTCRDVSDIYSLGLVTYEMLTGRRPFPDVTGPASMMAALLTQTPAPPSIHAAIPPGLDRIVMRCLAREPENRFADIGELAAALDRTRTSASDGREAITVVRPAFDPMTTLVDGDRAWVVAADDGETSRDDRATCEQPWAMPRIELPDDLEAATLAAAPIVPEPAAPLAAAAIPEPVAPRWSGLADPDATFTSRRTPSSPYTTLPGIAVAAIPRRTPTPGAAFPAQALCAACTRGGLCERCLPRALLAARPPSAPMVAPIGWQPAPHVRAWVPEPAIPLCTPGEPLASGSGPQPLARSHRVLWLALVIVCLATIVLAAAL
jgi:protein kinase-like protein